MSAVKELTARKAIRWTPRLIRRLRNKQTQTEFGALVSATTNTVWRWEDGRVAPDEEHARLLSELADREHFLRDWKLAGSGVLVEDLEVASRRLSNQVRETLQHRAGSLRK